MTLDWYIANSNNADKYVAITNCDKGLMLTRSVKKNESTRIRGKTTDENLWSAIKIPNTHNRCHDG
jgi:hypothetical protein